MEVIAAVFEMQMQPCILESKRSAVCLDVFYVCVLMCACGAHNDSTVFVSLAPIVCAFTGDERN